jgi:5-methylcytosine-specific restriction endonuclease McrA
MSILQDQVLVLNRLWQAIDVTTCETALCNLYRGVHTAIDMETLRPVTFDEWLTLPIRANDKSIGTVYGFIRVPTVIACVSYDKMPQKTPKLSAKSIRRRDGNRCQYTGKLLGPGEGNLDHVIPRKRGGKNIWENLVWSAKKVNQRKADRLPHEAGLKLIRPPVAPRPVPAMVLIDPRPDKPDWNYFLIR